MKKLILLCITAITLTSCKKTLLIVAGVRQPRIESDKSITRFLEKAGVSSNDVYHVDSSSSYTFWQDSTIVGRMPDLLIFNGKGELLRRLGKDECTGVYTDQLAIMDLPGAPVAIINTQSLASVLENYRRLDGMKTTIQDFGPDSFVACISYTDALGSVARDNIKGWTASLKKNKSADKIKILYMNMDMHTSWGIKSRKDPRRLKFRY
ncbi:MAG: hypothetical protein ABI772_07385 [Bacteroidota bacterium]